jgi:hypothetical protein
MCCRDRGCERVCLPDSILSCAPLDREKSLPGFPRITDKVVATFYQPFDCTLSEFPFETLNFLRSVAVVEIVHFKMSGRANRFSSWWHENFHVLEVPSNFAAHLVSVAVQDSEIGDRTLMPMFDSSQRLLDLSREQSFPSFRSQTEITPRR